MEGSLLTIANGLSIHLYIALAGCTGVVDNEPDGDTMLDPGLSHLFLSAAAQAYAQASDMQGCTASRLQGISAPTLQSTLNYALLAAAYGSYLLWVRKATSLSKPWWCYALLGLLDVEANFCLVSSWHGFRGHTKG